MKFEKEHLQILIEIKEHLGGSITEEEKIIGLHDTYDHGSQFLPRWYKEFAGGMLMFDFFEVGVFRIEVTLEPPHHLKIIPHSLFTKLLGSSYKSGDYVLDGNYCIQNAAPKDAKKTLDDSTIGRLHELMPFLRIEFTSREYRLQKEYRLRDGFNSHTAMSDIECFAEFVKHIHKDVWSMDTNINVQVI